MKLTRLTKNYLEANLNTIFYVFPELNVLHLNLQKLFRGVDGELSVIGRLAAGACAGMTSTFVSNAVVLTDCYLLEFNWVVGSVLFLCSWDLVNPCSFTLLHGHLSLFSNFLFFSLLSTHSITLYMHFKASCLYVDNIPFRCLEATHGSWTRVSSHVWGTIGLLVLYSYVWQDDVLIWSCILNVLFAGCTNHAERGRICLILLWSWTFPYWNSSLYCCELLRFWLVSPLMLYIERSCWRRIQWNVVY